MYSNIADSIPCYTSRKTQSVEMNPSDPKINPPVIIVPTKEKGWERKQNFLVFVKMLPGVFGDCGMLYRDPGENHMEASASARFCVIAAGVPGPLEKLLQLIFSYM